MATVTGLTAPALKKLLASNKHEGMPLVAYGHSLLFVGTGTAYPYCAVNYYDRIARRLRSQNVPPGNNNGVAGMLMGDAALYAMGNFTKTSRRGNVVATFAPSPNFFGGFVLVDALGNSSHNDQVAGAQAKMRAGTKNSLDALIRRLRYATAYQDTDATKFAFTGTWTNLATIFAPGGNMHYSAVVGDKVTITTPVGTDFTVIMNGFDNAAHVNIPGAAYTVKLDGAAYNWAWNPGTLSDQAAMTNGQLTSSCSWGPVAIPLLGLSNQAHTIEITHAGPAGATLSVSQLLTKSTTPPTIIIAKVAQWSAYAYSLLGASWATDQLYNTYVDDIVSRFGDDQSVVSWDPNAHGWDPTTMFSSVDPQFAHPNDLGMACYADGIMELISSLPVRKGLQIL